MRALGYGRVQFSSARGDPSSHLVLLVGTDIFLDCYGSRSLPAAQYGLGMGRRSTGLIDGGIGKSSNIDDGDWYRHQIWNFFLCFLSLEGDLPAQAKVFHCMRNFLRAPNPMCPWCSADGDTIPFTDVRAAASWRATVGEHVPWSIEPPLAALTRNGEATFLAKDIFHVVNLGIGRTFLASAICFFIHLGHFIPTDEALGRSIPVRIDEAYQDFKHFCKHVLKKTPMVKHWTRENLGWKASDNMPSTSFKASDTYLMLSWLLDYLQRPFQQNNYIKNMLACALGALLMP